MATPSRVRKPPRVNLFIADDVGLGNTIEAGRIAREPLRKKVRDVVVACPQSVLARWQDEVETRFGLLLRVMDREYGLNTRRQWDIDRADLDPGHKHVVAEELEAARERQDELRASVEGLRTRLKESRDWVGLDDAHFRATISCGLELLGSPPAVARLRPTGRPRRVPAGPRASPGVRERERRRATRPVSRPRADDGTPAVADLRAPLTDPELFDWRDADLAAVNPDDAAGLEACLPGYGETLRPTHAVREPDGGWALLVNDLSPGTPFDDANVRLRAALAGVTAGAVRAAPPRDGRADRGAVQRPSRTFSRLPR